MDTTQRNYVDETKTYKIPVSWRVYGEMRIVAKSLNDAIRFAEHEAVYPPVDEVDSFSLGIDYDIAIEINNNEEIGYVTD